MRKTQKELQQQVEQLNRTVPSSMEEKKVIRPIEFKQLGATVNDVSDFDTSKAMMFLQKDDNTGTIIPITDPYYEAIEDFKEAKNAWIAYGINQDNVGLKYNENVTSTLFSRFNDLVTTSFNSIFNNGLFQYIKPFLTSFEYIDAMRRRSFNDPIRSVLMYIERGDEFINEIGYALSIIKGTVARQYSKDYYQLINNLVYQLSRAPKGQKPVFDIMGFADHISTVVGIDFGKVESSSIDIYVAGLLLELANMDLAKVSEMVEVHAMNTILLAENLYIPKDSNKSNQIDSMEDIVKALPADYAEFYFDNI